MSKIGPGVSYKHTMARAEEQDIIRGMNPPAFAAPRLRHARMNLLLCLVIVFANCLARGTSFYNLDFESANNLPAPYQFVAVSNALPGWSVYYGTNQQTPVSTIQYQVNPATVAQPIDLIGSNSYVLSGNFSVILGGGAIAQTGVVPIGTESLTFQAFIIGSSSLTLSFDGQNVPYFAIGSATNSFGRPYTIYGANISAFAGQTETMDFFSSGANLDNIQFSSQPVPEPSGLALLSLGCGIFMCFRARLRRYEHSQPGIATKEREGTEKRGEG